MTADGDDRVVFMAEEIGPPTDFDSLAEELRQGAPARDLSIMGEGNAFGVGEGE